MLTFIGHCHDESRFQLYRADGRLHVCTEILWQDPEAHCRAIHLPPSPHVSAWYCTDPSRKDLYTIPGNCICPRSSMACTLNRHVTHWACLGCFASTCTTACSSSHQYPAILHSQWRRDGQHSTGHNQEPDQLYVKKMCLAAWGKWWSHQIPTGYLSMSLPLFLIHRLRPNECI